MHVTIIDLVGTQFFIETNTNQLIVFELNSSMLYANIDFKL